MTYGPEKTLKELLTGLKGAQVCGDDRLTVPSLAYHSGKVDTRGRFRGLEGRQNRRASLHQPGPGPGR